MSILRRNRTGLPAKLEQRDDGKPVIRGYAAVFFDPADAGTQYQMWEDIAERILPSAFDRALREKDDVRALFNHEASRVLGRSTSGTLRLSVDLRGLRYEIDPPDTETAREVMELMRRGDITASSFGFIPQITNYRQENELYIVERAEVQLFDVSPVTFPAYTSTESGVRGSEFDRAAVREEVHAYKRSRVRFDDAAIKIRARAVEVAMANN